MSLQQFIATVLVAAITSAGAIFSGMFGYLNTDRSHDIEMVRISLQILQGESTKESLPGRQFALRTLAKYSQTKIPEEEFSKWAEEGTIPVTIAETKESHNPIFLWEKKEGVMSFIDELEKQADEGIKKRLSSNIEECEKQAKESGYSEVEEYSRLLQSCLVK